MSDVPSQVSIQGPVSGQVAFGNYINQFQNLNGCTINISSPDQRPTWERKKNAVSGKPRPPSLFLDRVPEMRLIENSIQSLQPVNITGVAGIGKSTLLKRLLHLVRSDQFTDSIHHLHAYNRNMEDLLQDLFSTFYTSNHAAIPNRAQLQEAMQEIRALVVIDDLNLNADEIEVLLDMAPNSSFVIASTDQILHSGLSTVRLGGFADGDAIALFESTLGRSLNDDEKQIVCEISGMLKGHPQSLFWLAATTRQDGLILAEVREKLKVMSLQGLFQQSIQSLSTSQKKILAILAAVDNSPLSQQHLAALLPGEPIPLAVNDLAVRGLIQTQNQNSRLSESCLRILSQSSGLVQWEQAITRYFVNWLAQKPSWHAIGEVSDVLRKLLAKAAQRRDWSAVITLGRTLEPLLIMNGYWQAWYEILQHLLGAARSQADRHLEGWVLHQLGSRSLCLGGREEAASLLQQAAAIRKSIGDHAGLQITQHNLSMVTGVVPVTATTAVKVATSVKPLIAAVTGIAAVAVIGVSIAALSFFYTPPAPALRQPPNGYIQPTEQYPAFKWQSVLAGSTYEIQVDDQSDFISPIYDQTVSETSYVPGGILKQGIYYWRVRAKSQFDQQGNWSGIRQFAVSLPIGIPALLQPVDQFVITDPASLAFHWTEVDTALNYQLQVDNNSDFSSPEFEEKVSETDYVPAIALSQGKYAWRVRATNSIGLSGDWSNTATFTISIPPVSVQLVAPANGSKLETTTTPILQWQTVENGAEYEIQLDDNSDFSSPQHDTRQTANSFPVPVALAQGSYFWRVRAVNADGQLGGWSEVWSFIISIPPDTPTLIRPANRSVQLLTDMGPLVWTPVSNAAHYELQMDDSPNFDSVDFNASTIDPGLRLPTTLNQGVYFWRVHALNVYDTASGWSVPWKITINVPPDAPTLISPSSGYQFSAATPITFTWQGVPNAAQYQITVDTDNNFSSPDFQTSTSGTSITTSQNLPGGQYYWRVRAVNAYGTAGSPSPVWSFSIQLPAPSLISPMDFTLSDQTPRFEWSSVPNASTYEIQIAPGYTPSGVLIDRKTAATSIQFPTELYTKQAGCEQTTDYPYHWRVRAIDAAGMPGAWSVIWHVTFRVGGIC